jgi:transposase
MNGVTFTRSPIPTDEGLAERAAVATVCGDRGQADWRGGISLVAREAGVTRKTIRTGIRELEERGRYQPGERIRKQGGGRKKNTAKDATLRADLEELLEPKGDPESLLKWTSKEVAQAEGSPQQPGAYDW